MIPPTAHSDALETCLEMDEAERLTTPEYACKAFHNHSDNCFACHTEQTALCREGERLLNVASALREVAA